MHNFNKYISDLQLDSLDKITEYSKRSALENLLMSIAGELDKKIRILHEPRRKENYGSPDFLVYKNNSIIGYVENKKIPENLDKVLKSEQIKKYKELSDNILLTNYIEFIWIKKGVIERATLCYQSDLENPKFHLEADQANRVQELILNFLSEAPVGVSTVRELAFALAVRSRTLKTYLLDELEHQKKEQHLGRLFGLFQTFQEIVSPDLELSDFADAYSQMIVYGLFLAKLNAGSSEVSLRNADEFIPKSFQLIRELVSFFDELENTEYRELRWLIEETISIMNNMQQVEIQKSLSFNKNTTGDFEADPYIYFYEDFLSAYDSRLRKSKGVYYTPPQVVSFIVSSVNQLLTSDFDLSKGLSQQEAVTVLDFATGTGTFLIEIFKQILTKHSKKDNSVKKLLIKEHLLKNIYGFEYLIAPYTVAHLKLSQLLKEANYELSENERFQVYLTNTLEPSYSAVNLFLPGLTSEGKLAKKIKENPVLVITGNPPYSNSSSNKDAMILNLLGDYKKGLHERKINLDDDYIKFIRFAHNKISKSGHGIVAIITNNSYLDGITHRRMRESLLSDFDKIYIINLHGNSLKKEGDENVFDIRVGVAIVIFVKTPKPLTDKKVYYFSTKDNNIIKRQEKFDFLSRNSLSDIEFEELKPQKPNFWFVKKDLRDKEQYDNAWKLTDIFRLNSNGFESQNDAITIQFTQQELDNIKKDILKLDKKDFFAKYKQTSKRDWIFENAKADLQTIKTPLKINYHIFDERYTFYSQKSKGFIAYPRNEVMQHFENKQNIGIIATRQVATGDFYHSFVSQKIINRCFLSNKTREANSIFPLYTYNSNGTHDKHGNGYLFKEETKQDNFTVEFRRFIRNKYKVLQVENNQEIDNLRDKIKIDNENISKIKKIISTQTDALLIESLSNNIEELETLIEDNTTKLAKLLPKKVEREFSPSPEEILGYIYAIQYSPTYRKKYGEFLKFDFPRIPFCDSSEQFISLSKLGWQLIQVHLLNKKISSDEYKNMAVFCGKGEIIVDKISFQNNKLYINKHQYFDNIPSEVYEFKIGAYQVLHKYLKDRKGRGLSLNEIDNIENITKALKFTLIQMKLIDNEVVSWI